MKAALKKVRNLLLGAGIDTRNEARLRAMPRFAEAEVDFLGKTIRVADAASFLFIKKELFSSNIYQFECTSKAPYIIDCGANIGLSVIYFKQLFPACIITAFEPDDKVYAVLEHNTKAFAFENVELIKKACWNEDTILRFYSEGADAGRAADLNNDKVNIQQVEAVRLKDFIDKKVDFLKMDIEGAEAVVLQDIKDRLYLVDRLFVEYHSFEAKEQMLPEMLSLLKDAGFRLHLSSPGVTSPQPLIKVTTYAGMDNQLNIYAYRENIVSA